MKNIISLILLIFSMGLSAQNYKTHKIQTGETIERISKHYLVTPSDIYALNPDALTNFQTNLVLIIPDSKVKNSPLETEERKLIGYKKHRVKRKETLFGISQKYEISIEDLKKANRTLYSENLRKGDKLQIPQFKTTITKQTLFNTLKKYTVLPKEGKWRVAYKFGITVVELENLNPKLNPVLQPGDILNVPNISDNEEKLVEETSNYYEVLPAEGFYRLKVKLGLTQEQLETLNPELKTTGLNVGMVLKIPENIDVPGTIDSVKTTNLKSSLRHFSTKKLALLMPYRLNRIDIDSIKTTKEKIKESALLSATLDFHAGVLMALDSAKQLGISSDLKVFDTQYLSSYTSTLLRDHDFSNYDAVIGPMQADALERVATALKQKNIPVIAPLSIPKKVYSNVFQTIPEDQLMRKTMIDFVKADSLKTKIVVIADQKNKPSSSVLKKAFPNAKLIFSRINKKSGKDGYFLYPTDLETVFEAGKTFVFLETTNNAFASSVISMLNALVVEKNKIVLVTLDKNKAFDDNVDNFNLSNLSFHYASYNKTLDEKSTSNFLKTYKKEYGIFPNKYTVRGFDITLDILMRLAYKDNLYDASNDALETEYLENKFRYNKSLFGGYVNEAVYIVKYQNLRIVEAN